MARVALTDDNGDFYGAVKNGVLKVIGAETHPEASAARAARIQQFFEPPTGSFTVTMNPAAKTLSGPVLREKRISDDTSQGVDILGDPRFRFLGTPSLEPHPAAPTNFVRTPLIPQSTFMRYGFAVEFDTDATEVEIRLRRTASVNDFRFRINGQWVSEQATTVDLPSDVFEYYIKLTGLPVGGSRVLFESGGQSTAFGGVVVPTGNTVARPKRHGKRVAVLGASLVGGSGSSPDGATGLETWATRVSHMLGGDDYWMHAIGGTGYVAGAGTGTNYAARMSTLVASNPDIVIIDGSRNDTDDPGIRAAADAILAQLAAVPEVYVGGPLTVYTSNRDQLKAAAEAAGRPFIDPIANGWVTGTGNSATKAGDGNADWVVGPDGVHPTFAGHRWLSALWYEAITASKTGDPLGPWTTLALTVPPAGFEDTFTRADATINIGSTEVGDKPWQIVGANVDGSNGYMLIQGGQFGIEGIASNRVVGYANAGISDGVFSFDTPVASPTFTPRTVLRMVDYSNMLYLSTVSGSDHTWALWRRVGTTETRIATGTTTMTDGDHVDVTLAGSSITVQVNGVTEITVTETAHQTATNFGICLWGAPAATPFPRWDNIRMVEAA